jgi:hypothetical protein
VTKPPTPFFIANPLNRSVRPPALDHKRGLAYTIWDGCVSFNPHRSGTKYFGKLATAAAKVGMGTLPYDCPTVLGAWP